MNDLAPTKPKRGIGTTFLWVMFYVAVGCLSFWDNFIDRSHSYSWAMSITLLAAVAYPFLPKNGVGSSRQGFLQYLQIPIRVASFLWLALALFDLAIAIWSRGVAALVERAAV